MKKGTKILSLLLVLYLLLAPGCAVNYSRPVETVEQRCEIYADVHQPPVQAWWGWSTIFFVYKVYDRSEVREKLYQECLAGGGAGQYEVRHGMMNSVKAAVEP